jgi:hypothetical protein
MSSELICRQYLAVLNHWGLDFVACWFWKGAQYIQNSRAELALVATNSLCQESRWQHSGRQFSPWVYIYIWHIPHFPGK